MTTLEANCYIAASQEAVFDILSDHAGYSRWPGVQHSKLLTAGTDHPNGNDAVREIIAGPGIRFIEEIRAFRRPESFEYHIVKTTLPLRHHLGLMTVIPRGNGVEVQWRSEFDWRVPLIAGLLDELTGPSLSGGAQKVLLAIKRHLESNH